MNSNLTCYANAASQCLATFYPLLMKLIKKPEPGKPYPEMATKFVQILEEFNKDASAGPFDIMKIMPLGTKGSPTAFMEMFLKDSEAFPYLNTFELSGIIYLDYRVNDALQVGDFVFEKSRYLPDDNLLKIFTEDNKNFHLRGNILIITVLGGLLMKELTIKNHETGKLETFIIQAFTVHGGDHYIAFVKRGEIWYSCNDSRISVYSEDNFPTTEEKKDKFGWDISELFYIRK